MVHRSKFERKLPDDRRRILIAATLKCLSEDGQAGMSVRRISNEAGISVGLINHHYASKEDLVAQAYETLTVSLLDYSRQAVDREEGGARAKLAALVRSMFFGPLLDPGVANSSDLANVKPDKVRWVCNAWGRCWWRRNYWGPPRFYGGPYWGHRRWGHRHWRRW